MGQCTLQTNSEPSPPLMIQKGKGITTNDRAVVDVGRLMKRSQFSGDVSHVAFVAMDVDVAAVVTKVLPDVIGAKTSVLVLAQRPNVKGTINKARRELLVYAPNKKNVHAKLILVRYVGTDAGSPGGLRVIILTANNLGVGVNSLEDNRRIQVIFHQDFLCMKDKGAAPPTSSFGRRLGALMEALCEGAGARVHAHRRGLLQGVAFNNPRGEIITCFPGAGQTSEAPLLLVKEAITTEYQGAAAFVDGHTLWLSSSLGGGGAGVVPAAYMDWLRRAARCFNPGAPVGDAPDGPVGMSLVWPTKEEADRYLDDCPGLWVTPGVVASLVAAGSLVRGAQHIAAQLPPHAKVAVLYRQEQLASGPQTRLAYALVGSANASPAAWGGKNANCEVSILVLPSHECRFLTSPRVDLMALGGTVPACIQQPVHETWLVPRADGQRRLRWVEQQPDGTNRLMVVVPLPFKTERQPYAAGDVPYGSA